MRFTKSLWHRGCLLLTTEANHVQCTGKPGPVKDPTVSEITSSSCYISWEIPEDDGGSEITTYVVERKEEGRKAWIKVTDRHSWDCSFNS